MIPLGVTAVMLPELDFADQIALCRECGVTHYSIRPRIIADDQQDQPYSSHGNHKFDLTPARLVEEGAAIRAQLASAGMTPFGTLPAAARPPRARGACVWRRRPIPGVRLIMRMN